MRSALRSAEVAEARRWQHDHCGGSHLRRRHGGAIDFMVETVSGALVVQLLKSANGGARGASGMLMFSSGTAMGQNSGSISIGSSASTGGRGGSVTITVGAGNSGAGGMLNITAGESAFRTGGRVEMTAGYTTSSTSGAVLSAQQTQERLVPVVSSSLAQEHPLWCHRFDLTWLVCFHRRQGWACEHHSREW